jgi:hypothetical protein
VARQIRLGQRANAGFIVLFTEIAVWVVGGSGLAAPVSDIRETFWAYPGVAILVRLALLARIILAFPVTAVAPIVAVGVVIARAHVRVGRIAAIVAAPDVDVGRRPAGSQDDNFKGCHATWLIPCDLPLRPSLQVSGWSGIAVAALFAPPVGISLDNTSGDDVAV